jgi:hypothetical protein
MNATVCRLYALAGDFQPQALTAKAALLLYPEVSLHSRLVTLLHSSRREGVNLRTADRALSIDGLHVTAPPEGLLTLLLGLAETGWLSPVGPGQPEPAPRMAGEFFESETELRAVQQALGYEVPPGVTSADGEAHNELLSYASCGDSRLKLAQLELVDLLSAATTAEGAVLDARGSVLVDAVLASRTLSAEIEGLVQEPLQEQSDSALIDRVSQQFALQVVGAALPNLAGAGFADIDAIRRDSAQSIDAFRRRVKDLVADYVVLAPDASKFADHAAVTLAADYANLLDSIGSSRVLRNARQRGPTLVGSAVSLTSSLVLGLLTGDPLIATASFSSGMAALSLTQLLEIVRRRRELRGHYLYWRVSASRTTEVARRR